jgi:hypothetical protein
VGRIRTPYRDGTTQVAFDPVGGELLICDKNQTVGCSALVRSSFSKIRCKSSAYYKTARKPNQRSSSWVRLADIPYSPTQKTLTFLPLTASPPHSPHVRVRPTPNRQVGLGGIPIRIGFRRTNSYSYQRVITGMICRLFGRSYGSEAVGVLYRRTAG